MNRLHLLLIAAAVLLLGATSLCADTISLTVVPNVGSVSGGGTVSAAIEISGLQGDAPNGPSLGAYEFTLSWNSSILGDPIVTFGDPTLGDELALDSISSITCTGTACGGVSTSDSLTIGELSLDPINVLNGDQAAAFTLATVDFTAVGSGSTASLALSNIVLADAVGNSLSLGPYGAPSEVPEPRTGVVILAAGLAVLFIRHRRRSSARA
jgi:hypothetical protein